jgi:hypothetical protein
VAASFSAWIATLAAGLFAGAALYVSLVEHPARMSPGSRVAVHEFGPSYRRGAALQAPLSLIGALAAIARWALGGSAWWLAGGIAFGALVPYTLIVVLPTNKRLLDPALDRDSPEAATLLYRWGILHAMRTVVSVAVFAKFLVLLER